MAEWSRALSLPVSYLSPMLEPGKIIPLPSLSVVHTLVRVWSEAFGYRCVYDN